MRIVALFSLLLPFLACAAGLKAADLYTQVDDDCLAQMKANGVSTVIVRCYNSIGMVDSKCQDSINAIVESGLKAEVYIYPCPSCNNPEQQAIDTVKAVGSRAVARYWIIVENYQWKDQAYNQAFLQKMLTQMKTLGKTVGIFTSKSVWESVVGVAWIDMGAYPLWHKLHDGNAQCVPFKPFAGWKAPFMKQYTVSDICNGSALEATC